MILVIFGAGASYDSVHSRPPAQYTRSKLPDRLPLANELFLDGAIFQRTVAKFPQCHPIIPYLQNPDTTETIEHRLELFQTEANRDPVRMRQLAAIRFYIQSAIAEYESAWDKVSGGITNYVALLDQIRRTLHPGDEVCLVTFNYDRMLERAMISLGIEIKTINDYIADSTYKLYKLHGSVNWARVVDDPVLSVARTSSDYVRRILIEKADKLTLSNQFRIIPTPSTVKEKDLALFPAIAIPTQTKRIFECPDEHLQSLQALLPKVTKIVIIGWRATEHHFLNLLKASIKSHVPVCTVASKLQDAEDIFVNLYRSQLLIQKYPIDGGFTQFVLRRQAEGFLQ